MKRFLLFVLTVVLLVFFVVRWDRQRRENGNGPTQHQPEAYTPATAPSVDLSTMPILAAMDEEFTRLADAVMPSVVSLYTARRVQSRMVDPLEQFFGQRRSRPSIQTSLGSGVIVSKEGHILTNNHVIADMDEIKVRMRDGREFSAQVIGGDASVDIAVLKIDAENITPLLLGDSDKVRVSSLVLAIGNPFGLHESVTQGIISATGRQVFDESTTEFFQTDTAINPGNSGGPLVNLRGEIIGINTAIGNYSGSGTWHGVGFAIPANVARRCLESILKTGRVVHGYLGLIVQPLTPELASQFGASGQKGALIDDVIAGSPADKAGLHRGDIVTAVNGKAIDDVRKLLRLVAGAAIGETLEFSLIREGKAATASAVIEERPVDFQTAQGTRQTPRATPSPGNTTPLPRDHPLTGIAVAPIPPAMRSALPENVSGVVVTGVVPGAPASRVLRPGDIIEEIARQPVTNPESFLEVARSCPVDQRVLVSICRGRERSFIALP